MSNLALPTLAALTPPGHDIVICDENVEPIDFDFPADLVGITGYNIQSQRLFEIAAEFRRRGRVVVIGGPYASLCPEECEPHADVLLVGECERIWPEFFRDFVSGSFKPRYEEKEMIDMRESPIPRWDLLRFEDYGQILIQTTRGCPFNCEFCDVIVFLGRKVRAKTPEQVIAEIRAMVPYMYKAGHGTIFIADDNFVGNRLHAKKICQAIIELNKTLKRPLRFYTQVTINLANDAELLELMAEAGFESVFIGIETPRRESLVEANKVQNLGDLLAGIRKVQAAGIFVWAGMIVGFDHDDLGVFKDQLDFLQEAAIPISMTGMLNAPAHTPLWERLQKAGRLRTSNWIDQVTDTNILPLNMSLDELRSNWVALMSDTYSYENFGQRLKGTIAKIERKRRLTGRMGLSASHLLRTGRQVARMLRYYLLTTDHERRRFFLNIVGFTLRTNPAYMKEALWHVALLKHFQQYSEILRQRFDAMSSTEPELQAETA